MPKYLALADHLRTQIQTGQLKPGDQLPSISQLKNRFGVSYGTIRSAMLVLRTENLVEGQQGVGIFVAGGNDRALT